MLALTLPIAQTSLTLVESLLAEESMKRKRRENGELEEMQVTSSASDIARERTIPFAQKLTCTINEACDATGLGRTKLYELIGERHLATTTVGRRRLVVVRSLLSLLEPDTSV
jgi:excisionase family DNA binding protein